ncbi:hypothetical protein [Aureimonas sp. AU22]|uniref:hypothetical protein n=1 Tax=Aureimonas sp. AU22 TaxID=1638162 RepID=UPI0007817501|nr:hypothetical protein [Aureimonas sp. AU22]
MDSHTSVDLLTIALELRLAARDPDCANLRLTPARLLEMASVLERATDRIEPSNQNAQIAALRALSRARR